ncbi:MAG: Gx transporter family protein [Firmicutes bacterium]|nr:Gx transporter family protein [Bacillota bacterium]
MQLQDNKKRIKILTVTALLFAVAVILSAAEHTLPPIYPMFPGVKLGLSNIAVMFSLFFIKKSSAFSIALLKAFFVFAIKGAVAGVLSLLGGVLSLSVMILLLFIFKTKISYMILSISGAIFHNIGQVVGICIIYKGLFLWTYTPFLIVAGTVAGIATATLLRLILPLLGKMRIFTSQ